MGTRNLTIVKAEKKTRVAQYGQWDGYPNGQGKTIAKFLKVVDLKKFKKQVLALKEYTETEIKKAYADEGADPNSQFVSMDISDKVMALHPALNRDYGASILALIHEGKVKKVQLSESFKEDTLFCEYYYTIDLDKEVVSMNGGKEYPFAKWTKKLMEKLEKERG